MQVDTAAILRLLAHELRSPASVAQGYLKMIVEGRLPGAADQQQALEQARQAVGRLGALSREASEVASWLERPTPPVLQWRRLNGRTLIQGMLERVGDKNLDVRPLDIDEAADLRTCDGEALGDALAAIVHATIREAPHLRLTFQAATGGAPASFLDLIIAAPAQAERLRQGPSTPETMPFPLERGGVGLALIKAALVLEAHGAQVWSLHSQRAAAAVRLYIETGHAS